VPGYQWAPAWVSWRYSGDVVGWAPLAPGLSVYVSSFAFVDFWWTFVPTVSFCGVPVHGVAYGPSYARHYYGATRPAPPRPGYQGGGYRMPAGRGAPPAWGGPAPRLVEERSGRPLQPVRIVPSATPGRDRGRPGEIGVYRPEGHLGGGRGPGAASPPGRGGQDVGLPRGNGGGRGTAPVPAPGWEPQHGRGPGAASPPGRGGQDPSLPRGNGGGRGTAPVPVPGGGPRSSYQAPSAPQASGHSGAPATPSARAWSYDVSARGHAQAPAAPARGGGSERGGGSGGRGDGGRNDGGRGGGRR
jgi:hypothetical protein